MDHESTLTLQCVRVDGGREKTKPLSLTLSEAREVASRMLRLGKGRYTDVDICDDQGTIESLHKPATPCEILLVEDNAGDALLIGQALAESPKPVHLHTARDGEQALQILAQPDFHPNLVILDLNIPKISAYTVLALYHPGKKTPVVVFTSSESEAAERHAISLGASAFIHKPMDLNTYKTTVSRMVETWTDRESEADTESVLQ